MKFDLKNSIQILERTPDVLRSLLSELPEEWTMANEGNGTWSPYDIVGHLIHGEITDWMVRLNIILSENADKTFTPFDRTAQFYNSIGRSMNELLAEFRHLRKINTEELRNLDLKENDLDKEGIHPEFGKVTISQLLSAWVVHDLDHIAQISRIMANQYNEAAGPWKEYLKIIN